MQRVVTLVKYFGNGQNGTSLASNICVLPRAIDASSKLAAVVVKFPPVTCGNRMQSLLAENLARAVSHATSNFN